jgi:hypothetical protein
MGSFYLYDGVDGQNYSHDDTLRSPSVLGFVIAGKHIQEHCILE